MFLLQLLTNGIIRGLLYSLIGIGFVLIYRTLNIFHIAHAGIFVLGAYIFYTFFIIFKIPLFISLLFSLILSGIAGILIEKFFYHPLEKKKSSPLALFIVSLALYILIINIIALIFGNEVKIVEIKILEPLNIHEIIITSSQQIMFLISLISLLLFFIFLKFTKFGKWIKGYSQNHLLAISLGFPEKKIRTLSILIGSILAGIAGILAFIDSGIDPWGGLDFLLAGAVASIIGGIKRWRGSIVGGILLGIIQALVIWKFSVKWQNTVTYIILIIFLLVRPEGLIGRKLRVEEL